MHIKASDRLTGLLFFSFKEIHSTFPLCYDENQCCFSFFPLPSENWEILNQQWRVSRRPSCWTRTTSSLCSSEAWCCTTTALCRRPSGTSRFRNTHRFTPHHGQQSEPNFVFFSHRDASIWSPTTRCVSIWKGWVTWPWVSSMRASKLRLKSCWTTPCWDKRPAPNTSKWNTSEVSGPALSHTHWSKNSDCFVTPTPLRVRVV